ncbi:MAG: hypothetical protein H6502_04365 [Candidatus Woesearchaeota archaeon]|nr:MAG: hypothetical protein H6502_04365 [Candidatus Woesearchaeota archaeon]
MKRAQTLSLDLMIAAVIFVIIVVVFYAIMISSDTTPTTASLHEEANAIYNSLNVERNPSTPYPVIDGTEIDPAELERLYGINPDVLRETFNSNNNFCIFLADENKNIVFVYDGTNNKAGVGDDEVNISQGITCNMVIP